jgi:hypothetical protein
MYSSLFVSGLSGCVFGQFDYAAGDALQFANILTTFADYAPHLLEGNMASIIILFLKSEKWREIGWVFESF